MSPATPPNLGRRWWNAQREERVVRALKISTAVLVVLVLGFATWGVVRLMEAPDQKLARTCATGPWALQTITAAGGPDAVEASPEALEPYTRLPAVTGIWLTDLRAHASGADRPELARQAFLVLRGGFIRNVDHLAAIEQACAAHLEATGTAPDPNSSFVPDAMR